MKLKKIFESIELNSKITYVSIENDSFNGIIQPNSTANFILEQLKCDITQDVLVRKVEEHYHINKEQAQKGVSKILEELRGYNLLMD